MNHTYMYIFPSKADRNVLRSERRKTVSKTAEPCQPVLCLYSTRLTRCHNPSYFFNKTAQQVQTIQKFVRWAAMHLRYTGYHITPMSIGGGYLLCV